MTDSHETDWVARLETVYDAAINVARARDLGSALQAIVDSARNVVQAEMAALGVPGEEGQPMAQFVVSGVDEKYARSGTPPMGRGVLGILLEGAPLRHENISAHPAYEGTPHGHPTLRSFLGVPVQSGGETIGDLYIANKIGSPDFTPADQRLAEMLATYAAVAIQNMRYQEQSRDLATMQERERVARDIQDNVIQDMYGVGLLLRTIELSNPEQAASQLETVQAQLDTAIEYLRTHLLDSLAGPSVQL